MLMYDTYGRQWLISFTLCGVPVPGRLYGVLGRILPAAARGTSLKELRGH